MKKYLLCFFVIMGMIKESPAIQNAENIQYDEYKKLAKERCNNSAIPYRPAKEDEDDFREKIAFNLVIAEKEKETPNTYSLDYFEYLFQLANKPCLRYPNDEELHDKWVRFSFNNQLDSLNFQENQPIENNYVRFLKLDKKFSYLANIFKLFNDKYPENMEVDLFGYTEDTIAQLVKSWVPAASLHQPKEKQNQIYDFLKDELTDCYLELEACKSFFENQLNSFKYN